MCYEWNYKSEIEIFLSLILGQPAAIDRAITYIKLDFIGVKYMEQFKDKSSQEFKTMAHHIEQEVRNGAFFLSCQNFKYNENVI